MGIIFQIFGDVCPDTNTDDVIGILHLDTCHVLLHVDGVGQRLVAVYGRYLNGGGTLGNSLEMTSSAGKFGNDTLITDGIGHVLVGSFSRLDRELQRELIADPLI